MRRLLIAAALCCMAAEASASTWGSYSDWEVTGDESDNTCMFAREFEGPGDTMMGVVADARKKAGFIFVGNLNWSVKKGDTPRIGVDFSGTDSMFEGISFGFRSDGRGLFGLPFKDLTFLDVVARATGADFYRIEGEGDEAKLSTIDELQLDGTGAAVAALKRCLAHQSNLIAAAERYRKKWEHIPTDPFAKK